MQNAYRRVRARKIVGGKRLKEEVAVLAGRYWRAQAHEQAKVQAATRVATCVRRYQMQTQYKRKVADLQLRVKEFESNVIEIAARKLVDEARRSVHDEEWASVKRKLSLAFHPDKLRCCPNAGASFFKAFANHPRW